MKNTPLARLGDSLVTRLATSTASVVMDLGWGMALGRRIDGCPPARYRRGDRGCLNMTSIITFREEYQISSSGRIVSWRYNEVREWFLVQQERLISAYRPLNLDSEAKGKK